MPGATPAREQNSEVDTPGRALTTNVNGMDRNNNGTKTDGATNVNIWLPHHTMYVSPAETIDTVNVSTSNFDAEQGNAGGAAITVITKSGTNDFKGSAFAFYNNQNFNARPYFATEKPDASSHIDGVTLGGPIMKNKLFFFGAWEGQYQRTPQQFFFSVPTAALRVGDFSQAFNPDGSLQVIYDPATGNPDGSGRSPSRATSSRRIASATSPGRFRRCTRFPTPTGETLQRQRRRRGHLSQLRAPAGPEVRPQQLRLQGQLQPVAVQPDLGQVLAHGRQRDLAAGVPWLRRAAHRRHHRADVHIRRHVDDHPTMVFDATLGISKMNHTSQESDLALGNFGLETLGIPGMNGGSNFSNDPRYAGIPFFLMGSCWCNFDIVGNANGWDPVERDERTYAFASNLTKLKGAHEFRFGYSVNKLRMDHWHPGCRR